MTMFYLRHTYYNNEIVNLSEVLKESFRQLGLEFPF